MNQSRYLINEKAEQAGIAEPVVVDEALLKSLTPNDYLKSLGITLDNRIENLFWLFNATRIEQTEHEQSETVYTLPYVILTGPFVREDLIVIRAKVETDAAGCRSITLREDVTTLEEE